MSDVLLEFFRDMLPAAEEVAMGGRGIHRRHLNIWISRVGCRYGSVAGRYGH